MYIMVRSGHCLLRALIKLASIISENTFAEDFYGGAQVADNHNKETRSYNMSRIRATNSKPEEIVRKYLFGRGLRYRKNVASLPGKPDIVFPKYKTIVFVNGCFWHKHSCKRFVWPSSNADYWVPKLERNVARDIQNQLALEALGWRVLTIWECELKKKVAEISLRELYNLITNAEPS